MNLSRLLSFIIVSSLLGACSASDDQNAPSASGQCITENARDADHISVVEVGNDVETWCNGMLIARDLVLTTAKCLQRPKLTRVYSGPGAPRSLSTSFDQLGVRPYGVAETRAHPGYTGDEEPTNQPDLGLLRLDAPADFASGALATSPPAPSDTCVVVGYGESFSQEKPDGDIGERKIANVRVRAVGGTIIEVEGAETSPSFAEQGGALICNGKLAGIGLTSTEAITFFERVDAEQREHSKWIETNSASLADHGPCGR